MKLQKFIFNPIGVNTYVISDENAVGAIIDCGCATGVEEKLLANYIKKENIKITHILNTHLHFDHVYGNSFAVLTYGVLTEASEKDVFLLDWNQEQVSMYNMPMLKRQNIGCNLEDGNIIKVGSLELSVLALPGHTPGGLGFYCQQERCVFAGDTIFQSSIGRTDLPGGDYAQLVSSIATKLYALPDDTIIYTGHGKSTSINYEKENNPYIY